MKRKRYYLNLQELGKNLSGNGGVWYNELPLYTVKMQKAYNLDGYGDAVLLGNDYKLYSVTNNLLTNLYNTAFSTVPDVIIASYKSKPCLVALTENKKVIISNEIKEFSMPLCSTHCFFDNRLFGAIDRNVYYSQSFDIDVFTSNEFVLPPTFGKVVKMCRVNDVVIIGCERGAWKLAVKNGLYSVENFTADIISETLISCMDGGIYLSKGGICYTNGKSIKKINFPFDITLRNTLGYHAGKCYLGCVLQDKTQGVLVYDFATQKYSVVQINVSSIGGKVGVTSSGIVTFNDSLPTVEYVVKNADFGSGCMKKICAVTFKGKGEFSLAITGENDVCKINGISGKIVYGYVDGRSFDILLKGQPNAIGLEILYYQTGGGL